jgi:hypothetical protein
MDEEAADACLRLREAVVAMKPLVRAASAIGKQCGRQGLEFAATFLEQTIAVFVDELENFLEDK